jgi:nicotinamidase-related amidase
VIGKTANDSFYNTNLDVVLKENKITDLFITGCATDFCVDATIHSALTRDYNVVVIKDCHTTADRPHLSAEKVIQHHNWLWENLMPTKGGIKLVTVKDLLKNQMHFYQ